MNKKKVTSLLVAGALTVGIVGGTLAWLTASDSVTNKFTTITADAKLDVDIWERFTEPTAVKPGDKTDKLVQVKNTSKYDQFIRVKVTPKFEKEGLDVKKILVNYVNADGKTGNWVKDGDYYYYLGKVKADGFTKALVDGVKLDGTAGLEYQGAKYDVVVDADAIQASNGAAADAWTEMSETTKSALTALESAEAGDAGNAGTTENPTVATK